MTLNNLIETDYLRPSWLILCFWTNQEPNFPPNISSWEIGIGNSERLVHTTSQAQNTTGDNQSPIESLLMELDLHRYQGSTIITLANEDLKFLRRCMIDVNDSCSLRGFAHICIENLLERYFAQDLSDHGLDTFSLSPPRRVRSGSSTESRAIQHIWNRWTRIRRLVPSQNLVGCQL